jgi:hypothetical protein
MVSSGRVFQPEFCEQQYNKTADFRNAFDVNHGTTLTKGSCHGTEAEFFFLGTVKRPGVFGWKENETIRNHDSKDCGLRVLHLRNKVDPGLLRVTSNWGKRFECSIDF